MLVYEVNIEIDAPIRDAYLQWLEAHVREIRALPGFTGARTFEVSDPPPAAGTCAFCVQYHLVDEDALATYLRDDAPRLRADGVQRFGAAMRATRRVMQRIDSVD